MQYALQKNKKQEQIFIIQIVPKAGPRPRYDFLAVQDSSIGDIVTMSVSYIYNFMRFIVI